MNEKNPSLDILLVEDNPADVRLTREALRESHMRNNLHVVQDGVEALQFVRRQGHYAQSPRPALILLDLNLPRKNGFEVLQELKADSVLRRIPVVVLTTSQLENDVLAAYDLHANCYLNKPVSLEAFIQLVQAIEDFWLKQVRLPSL